MKALITGGAGFIGSNLADRLFMEGFSVCVVDNLSSGFLRNVQKEIKLYLADIRDTEIINKIFEIEKPDYVFHLAAQIDVRLSVKNPIFDAATNILGGINLLENQSNRVSKSLYMQILVEHYTEKFQKNIYPLKKNIQ